MKTLQEIQKEQWQWACRNFGDDIPWQMSIMGITEEVGELNHALLKQWQGIRGTSEQHEEELRAEPDNLVLLCKKCHLFVHSRKNKTSEFIKELDKVEDDQ